MHIFTQHAPKRPSQCKTLAHYQNIFVIGLDAKPPRSAVVFLPPISPPPTQIQHDRQRFPITHGETAVGRIAATPCAPEKKGAADRSITKLKCASFSTRFSSFLNLCEDGGLTSASRNWWKV